MDNNREHGRARNVASRNLLRQMQATGPVGAGAWDLDAPQGVYSRPPIARYGVIMLQIGCQTVLAWVESPVQRIDAGPVGIHLQGNFGDALLSIDEIHELQDALTALVNEATYKKQEISKLAGEDLP